MVGPTGMVSADRYLPASETEPLKSHRGERDKGSASPLPVREPYTFTKNPLFHTYTPSHTHLHIDTLTHMLK